MLGLRHKKYRFNSEKDLQLLQMPDRLIGFEKIIEAIIKGDVLDIRTHPNKTRYPHQYIIYVHIEGKVYAVPCVEEGEDGLFLKTIYPSSKMRDEFFPNCKKNNKS